MPSVLVERAVFGIGTRDYLENFWHYAVRKRLIGPRDPVDKFLGDGQISVALEDFSSDPYHARYKAGEVFSCI